MFTNLARRIANILIYILILASLIGSISIGQAAPLYQQRLARSGPQVISAVSFDVSRPLDSVAPIPLADTSIKPRTRLIVPKTLNSVSNDVTDAFIVQTNSGRKPMSNSMEIGRASCRERV